MVGIYKITNNKNGKVYIGSSRDIVERFYKHKYDLRNKRSKRENEALIADWHKYGEDAFEFEVLEKCGIKEIMGREAYWIKKYTDKIGKKRIYNFYDLKSDRKPWKSGQNLAK